MSNTNATDNADNRRMNADNQHTNADNQQMNETSTSDGPLADESSRYAYRDESWLREKYVNQQKSLKEVGDEVGVSTSTIHSWLNRHGIDSRTPGETMTDGNTQPLRSEAWLCEQYQNQQKSSSTIGDELGVSSSTVTRWLRKHGIETRSLSESLTDGNTEPLKNEAWLREQYIEQELSTTEIGERLGVTCGAVGHWLNKHEIEGRGPSESQTDGNTETLKNESWLRHHYLTQEKTAEEIAQPLNVTTGTVLNWLRRHDIEARGRGEAEDRLRSGLRNLRNKQWLQQKIEENQPITDIGDECGVTSAAVHYWLDKHGIETDIKVDPTRNSMSAAETYRDKSWMQEQYVERHRSTTEIGEELGVSKMTISRWLRRHGIETRGTAPEQIHTGTSQSEDTTTTSQGEDTTTTEGKYRNEEWLRERYQEEERTTAEIGRLCGVSKVTISRWLRSHEIETRGRSESKVRDPSRSGSETEELNDPHWLREQYIEEGKSQREIGDALGVSATTVRKWLGRHEISA